MAHERLFHVGVKALLQRPDGTVLVMKTKVFDDGNSHWDIAGGRIQDGQTELEALHREIAEETGLADYGEPQYFGSCISNIQIPVDDEKTVGLVLIVYRIQVPQEIMITMSEEYTDFEWVALAEAAERLKDKYPPAFTRLLVS